MWKIRPFLSEYEIILCYIILHVSLLRTVHSIVQNLFITAELPAGRNSVSLGKEGKKHHRKMADDG